MTRLTGLAEAGSGDTWKQAYVHVVCRWWVALTLVRVRDDPACISFWTESHCLARLLFGSNNM